MVMICGIIKQHIVKNAHETSRRNKYHRIDDIKLDLERRLNSLCLEFRLNYSDELYFHVKRNNGEEKLYNNYSSDNNEASLRMAMINCFRNKFVPF